MPGFQLRPVRAEDSQELFRIHRESMTEHLEQALDGWSEEQAWEHHLRCMTSSTAQVIIVGGQVAGSLEVVADDHKQWIVRIEIDPRFQRQGLGTAIVQQIQRRAEGQSMPVVLEVFAHNPARHLYERLGFRAASRDGPSIRMEWGSGTVLDAG